MHRPAVTITTPITFAIDSLRPVPYHVGTVRGGEGWESGMKIVSIGEVLGDVVWDRTIVANASSLNVSNCLAEGLSWPKCPAPN